MSYSVYHNKKNIFDENYSLNFIHCIEDGEQT